MPLIPAVLQALIEPQLKAIPIGMAPASAQITQTPGADGTCAVSVVAAPSPVFMDPKMATVIAAAVANAVCSFLLANAVVVGTSPAGPVTGKIT